MDKDECLNTPLEELRIMFEDAFHEPTHSNDVKSLCSKLTKAPIKIFKEECENDDINDYIMDQADAVNMIVADGDWMYILNIVK